MTPHHTKKYKKKINFLYWEMKLGESAAILKWAGECFGRKFLVIVAPKKPYYNDNPVTCTCFN